MLCFPTPFGGIHVFIGKIGESEPEPDTRVDIIETAQRARPTRVQPGRKHTFVGFVHGADLEEGSMSGGETTIYSGDEFSAGKTESIYNYKTAGSRAIPMVTVFWTPMSRRAGPLFSWLARNQC